MNLLQKNVKNNTFKQVLNNFSIYLNNLKYVDIYIIQFKEDELKINIFSNLKNAFINIAK